MKKIIILTLCLMLLFTACSSKEAPANVSTTSISETANASIPENYVGDATLETLKALLNMHVIIETQYLIKDRPAVDFETEIEYNGSIYVPVTGGIFSTYDEFKEAIYDTYVKESADFALNSTTMYADIDGQFCFNTYYKDFFSGENYTHDWSEFTIEPTEATDDKIVFTVYLKYSSGDVAAITMTALMQDGNWRLIR